MSNLETPDEYEWGGDGSDVSQPVAEHVRAALVPSTDLYPPPIDKLLKLGSPHDSAGAPPSAAGWGLGTPSSRRKRRVLPKSHRQQIVPAQQAQEQAQDGRSLAQDQQKETQVVDSASCVA